MYLRKIMRDKNKRNWLLAFFIVLAVLGSTNVIGGEETSVNTATIESSEGVLKASFVGFGSVDIANLAISLGGYTTYLDNSSLIGISVEQQYQNNTLVSETVAVDGGSLKAKNDTGGGYGSITIKAIKTKDQLSYTICTSNSNLMRKVLPKVFNLDYGYTPDELNKYFGLDNSGNVEDYELILNNGGHTSIMSNGCKFTCSFPSSQEVLFNSTDFITTDDLISNWNPYKLLIADSTEHSLLYKPELWKDAKDLLDNYSIKERKYLITYAPNDTGAKTANMDNWHINNINQITTFIAKNNMDKQWRYVVTTVPETNTYNDKRLYVSNISSQSLSQAEIESLSALIYGNKPNSPGSGVSDTYSVGEDGSISHTISRTKEGAK